MRTKSWTLTDIANDVWLDSFAVGNDSLRLATPHDWSIRKRTLRGGVRDGVDLIEVHNGALSYSILPTRGMGLWRGAFRGNFLGWSSPVQGPVHPKLVALSERNGLGWLRGFDEWMCRCGLACNGPPGMDNGTPLTLHGRIANLPAHHVEVRVNLDPPYELSVVGRVAETELFGPHLHLTATVTTVPGSGRLVIHDEVENRSATAAEMQLLYHCNLGPPFLEAGSRVMAPTREVAPLTNRAAEGMDTLESYSGPIAGFTEQVYAYDLAADQADRTLVLLSNSAGDRGLALRFNRRELPWFTVWKNTAAPEDGYVTGLEPATNLPNFRTFERQQGRVVTLPPGGRWQCQWSLEAFDTREAVGRVLQEIATLQAHSRRIIHRMPQPRFSPT
ncbi:MAG: aldose 1-epimerase family protein [Gemmataceae bacterium]